MERDGFALGVPDMVKRVEDMSTERGGRGYIERRFQIRSTAVPFTSVLYIPVSIGHMKLLPTALPPAATRCNDVVAPGRTASDHKVAHTGSHYKFRHIRLRIQFYPDMISS